MSVTSLMIFVLISQVLIGGYLLYCFNAVEREARKRNADLRAHIDRCFTNFESRVREAGGVGDEPARKRALG